MPISEVTIGPSRNRLGFVRRLPPEDTQALFRSRGYQCFLIDKTAFDTPGSLETTDSVVLSQQENKVGQLKADLRDFSRVLDYDCRLYLRYLPDPTLYAYVLGFIAELQLPPSGFDKAEIGRFSQDWFDPALPLFGPFVHIIRADDDWNALANLIATNPAGRPPSMSTKIEPPGVIKSHKKELAKKEIAEREILIKRAFSDCSAIELRPKSDGMSGVDAFEAFAYRRTSVVGSKAPYRCFVKIGPRIKVAREFERYRATALEDVPFHLGPRLRLNRCVLGKSQGLLTCDYVAGAETLRDCIRDGRGVHVIGNLFNQTLISWRRGSELSSRPLQDFLADHLRERNSIPEHRAPLIKMYGATKSLGELKVIIAGSPPSEPVRVGTIHGDLHATNVLVRMNDAVIIDLERVAAGQPLLFDAASLEGGLFVDGFVGDLRDGGKILESLRPFYSVEALNENDHHCDPADRSAWFVDSVRQIRMQAHQMEREANQYAWTLAAVLLKKACNPEQITESVPSIKGISSGLTRENVRALAFVLAEYIILELSGNKGSAPG